jgi:hypothetical protein
METTSRSLAIRAYTKADFSTLREWWDGHGASVYPETILPPSGVIVERDGKPVAAGFLMLIEQTNLAFFHGMVTKPGMGRRDAWAALQELVAGLDIIMQETGRTLMLGNVPEGAMTIFAKKLGFEVVGPATNPVARITYPLESHGT